MTGTIVEITVPAAQFALEYTLSEFEHVTFEVEQVAATNQDSLMPFMRIETTDRVRLEEAFAIDDSVDGFELIATFETDCLYKFDWADRIDHLIRVLVDQNATIQTAVGQTDHWNFRLIFADREAAASTNEYCKEQGIDFEVRNIQEFGDRGSNRFGLTDYQRTAIQLAADRGYYEVPREATADDLAEEFGISHQALSERLRRAHGSLIQHVLGIRNEKPDPAESPPETHSETSVD